MYIALSYFNVFEKAVKKFKILEDAEDTLKFQIPEL